MLEISDRENKNMHPVGCKDYVKQIMKQSKPKKEKETGLWPEAC